jgi:hypothetical protein
MRTAFFVLACAILVPVTTKAGQPVDFVHDVQPILRRNCYRCHGSQKQQGSLQLNLRESAFATADSDQLVIVPHDADASLLIRRLFDEDCGDVMPLDGQPLSNADIGILRRWVAEGAVWPDELAEPQHWAYRPIDHPQVPRLAGSFAAANSIDQFILRQLGERGLEPSPRADRARLLRRVSLALIGLPPSPDEVDSFLRDTSPDAYERVVDRLLSLDRYGERWAVPWLDLARYADSNGFQADQIRDNWAYRDWVIRAFNQNMPFDQFVIDQIAGDLRPNPSADQQIATGFHRMTTCNVEAGVDPEANRVNQIVDRVNTTATVFLGTTMECAQCHDHKYDPFTQRDYYQLFAYFNNTPLEVENTSGVTWDFYGPKMALPLNDSAQRQYDELQLQLADRKSERERAAAERKKLQAAFDKHDPELTRIDQHISRLEKQIQESKPTTLVMVEMEQPRETFILTRGDYENPADRVEPGTPEELPPISGFQRTGDRLELAKWLTSPENPLLARVTVNRWWGEFFGTGIVNTAEDFGTQADDPSHPELLDWLATELIESGWSMKHVHKLIVMSEAFRQRARVTSELLEADPNNRWLARGPRFRLSAEIVRDNALAISGLLSAKMYGPPIMPYQPDNIWRSVGRNQPTWQASESEDRFRRGIYVICKRAAPYPSFVTFDSPDRGNCTVRRARTNTPLQALTLLNDPAYVEMALAMADRVMSESPLKSDEGRIRYAMVLALARPAESHEVDVLKALLTREREMLTKNQEMVQARTRLPFKGMRLQSDDTAELAAWFAIANAVLNLDESVNQ